MNAFDVHEVMYEVM